MMSTVRAALTSAKQALSPHTETPVLEAEVLLAHVLQCPRTRLIAWPDQALTSTEHAAYTACIDRRVRGEPLAYLTGKKEFWSREFSVTTATLIPREDTETLIETALAACPSLETRLRVADLGTGSGIIAITLQLARPQWEVHAVDISKDACACASKNAHAFGCERIVFHTGSWCNALPSGGFDLVVSNPPYLSEAEWPWYAAGLQYEPRAALVSGDDGLSALREIIDGAKQVLNPDGLLLLEHGFEQGDAVLALLRAKGYVNVSTINDGAGRPRVAKAHVSR